MDLKKRFTEEQIIGLNRPILDLAWLDARGCLNGGMMKLALL